MQTFLAAFPILTVILLMVVFRWGGQRAGPAGWAVTVLVAALSFGLTPEIWWVSQAKGLLLSFYVLSIFWPALLLYNVVDRVGGIRAISNALDRAVGDRGLLVLILAWAFSGTLEGLAGFGLPVAVVSPMLAGLGVDPLTAVAATAIGHAWSVTFGDMGVIFQSLLGVVHMQPAELVGQSALMLGVACVVCGLATALVLKQVRWWPLVLGLGLLMAVVQAVMAAAGLTQLAAFGAGIAGMLGGIAAGKWYGRRSPEKDNPEINRDIPPHPTRPSAGIDCVLWSYGGLTALMALVALPGPVRSWLYPFVWQTAFPEVTSRLGFITPASTGQIFRIFTHPGTILLLVAGLSGGLYLRTGRLEKDAWRGALLATWRSAAPASVGVIATVGLAALMEHSGMTLLLAQQLSAWMGPAFPLVSPWVGMLGAFATGSNNNSNVLLGMLQKNAALILGLPPAVIVAAQTTGGALGSMIAPAKIIVGCSTLGLKGKDGDVLRRTLPYGLAIGMVLGILALVLTR